MKSMAEEIAELRNYQKRARFVMAKLHRENEQLTAMLKLTELKLERAISPPPPRKDAHMC